MSGDLAGAHAADSFRNVFLGYQQLDAEKSTIIERLQESNKVLRRGLNEAWSKLREQNAKSADTEATLEASLKASLKESQSLTDRLSRETFVLVLIDGDNMPFRHRLVQQAREGGHAAARLLKREVQHYVKKKALISTSSFKIVIRVYANVKMLARTYCDYGVLSRTADFENFVRGFNMESGLCDYVDADDGKECADDKCKGEVNLNS